MMSIVRNPLITIFHLIFVSIVQIANGQTIREGSTIESEKIINHYAGVIGEKIYAGCEMNRDLTGMASNQKIKEKRFVILEKKSLNFVESKTITLPRIDDKLLEYKESLTLGNSVILLLTKRSESSSDPAEIYLWRLNEELNPISEPVVIFGLEDNPEESVLNISFHRSSDSNSVYVEIDWRDELAIWNVKRVVYKEDLGVISNKLISLPVSDYFKVWDYYIDSREHLHLLLSRRGDQKLTTKMEIPFYMRMNFGLEGKYLCLDQKGEVVIEQEILYDEKSLYNFKFNEVLEFEDSNRPDDPAIFITGQYSNLSNNELDYGFFYMKLDEENKIGKEINFVSCLPNDKQIAIPKFDLEKVSKGIANVFSPCRAKNGTVFFVAEFYSEEQSSTKQDYGKLYTTEYFFNELFIWGVDAIGQHLWSTRIDKKQRTKDNVKANCSVMCSMSTKGLEILYNDNRHNHDDKPDRKLFFLSDGDMGAPVVVNASVDFEGKLAISKVDFGAKINVILNVPGAFPASENNEGKILVVGTKAEKMMIGAKLFEFQWD